MFIIPIELILRTTIATRRQPNFYAKTNEDYSQRDFRDRGTRSTLMSIIRKGKI